MAEKKSSNHEKAPLASKFVNAMREAFGEVTVLYVEENGLTLGRPSDDGVELAAATTFVDTRKSVLAKKAA